MIKCCRRSNSSLVEEKTPKIPHMFKEEEDSADTFEVAKWLFEVKASVDFDNDNKASAATDKYLRIMVGSVASTWKILQRTGVVRDAFNLLWGDVGCRVMCLCLYVWATDGCSAKIIV